MGFLKEWDGGGYWKGIEGINIINRINVSN